MKEKFCITDYRVGDRIRLFGCGEKQFFIVYIKELKKYVVLGYSGQLFNLEDAHYYRIRSIKRNDKLIAKRKRRSDEIIRIV